jgi:hypothetical protein
MTLHGRFWVTPEAAIACNDIAMNGGEYRDDSSMRFEEVTGTTFLSLGHVWRLSFAVLSQGQNEEVLLMWKY